MDMFNHLIHDMALNGKLHITELRKPSTPIDEVHVLDIGSGTGTWCSEMAGQYPRIQIHGFDIKVNNEVDPTPYPNCKFYEGIDFNASNWGGFADNSFDLIRASRLCGYVQDWEHLYRNMFR